MAAKQPNQRGIFPGLATHFKGWGSAGDYPGEKAKVMTQVRDKRRRQRMKKKRREEPLCVGADLLRLNYLSSIFIQPSHDNAGGGRAHAVEDKQD